MKHIVEMKLQIQEDRQTTKFRRTDRPLNSGGQTDH